jgi:hypothetical protein
LATKNLEIKDHPDMEGIELYWKPLLEKKNNTMNRMDKRGRKGEIKSMNYAHVRIKETNSFLANLITGSLLQAIKCRTIG